MMKDASFGYRVVNVRPEEIYELFSDKIAINTATDNIQNDHRTLQQVADELKSRLENTKKKMQKLSVKFGDLGDLQSNKDIQVRI